MAFSEEQLHFDVFYPDRKLLDDLVGDSPMRTPQKVEKVLGDLRFPVPKENKPYLYGCMVLSFDGKMGFYDNPEGHLISKNNTYDPVGGTTDFWIMNVCRTYADAVILGTGTLKARINKLWFAEIVDPDLIKAREGLNKATPQPLNLIASIDGTDIPFQHPIFTGIDPKPLIMTSVKGAQYVKEHAGFDVKIITEPEDLFTGEGSLVRVLAAGQDQVDTKALMKLLKLCGLHYISVEAPGYIWNLIREKMLDEYLLNYSGVMVGGSNIVGANAGYTVENHPHAALLSIGFHKGFIFTRQKLVYEGVK